MQARLQRLHPERLERPQPGQRYAHSGHHVADGFAVSGLLATGAHDVSPSRLLLAWSVTIGETELANQTVALKQMATRVALLEREIAMLRGEEPGAPAEVVPLRPARGPSPAGG